MNKSDSTLQRTTVTELATQEEVEQSAAEAPAYTDIEAREFISQLQNTVTEQSADIFKLKEGLVELRAEKTETNFIVGDFIFTLKTLPKQDVMIAGVNSLGRTGLVLEAFDGEKYFPVAKMTWDHVKQSFVINVGQGVI